MSTQEGHTLCHMPSPEGALAEAFRVLAQVGQLAVFDGDYATTTVATGDGDPLQACADAAIAYLVHDRWLIRRLPALVRGAGFAVSELVSRGCVQTTDPSYMLTLVDRGADQLAASGRIGVGMADSLKAEARRRSAMAPSSVTLRMPSCSPRSPEVPRRLRDGEPDAGDEAPSA